MLINCKKQIQEKPAILHQDNIIYFTKKKVTFVIIIL